MGVAAAIRPDTALASLLGDYSTEVLPRDRASIEAAPDLLERGAEVFIAAVPGDGADRMAAAAARLRDLGLTPVPHVVARNLAGLADLDRLLGRLRDEAGVDRALVLGGDRDHPAGVLHSSQQLIESGLFARRGVRKLFVACYPEGHPQIPDDVLEDARAAKLRVAAGQGLAVTLVSQFCFEARPIVALARRMRARGIQVPYRVGVAGPGERATLIRYGLMCGVGASLRALKQRQGMARSLLSGETPEAILSEVAAAARQDPSLNISGVHFFTFGAHARAAEWAERMRG